MHGYGAISIQETGILSYYYSPEFKTSMTKLFDILIQTDFNFIYLYFKWVTSELLNFSMSNTNNNLPDYKPKILYIYKQTNCQWKQ